MTIYANVVASPCNEQKVVVSREGERLEIPHSGAKGGVAISTPIDRPAWRLRRSLTGSPLLV